MALLVSLRRPDLVRRLGLVSGLFHRDGWIMGPSTEGELPAGIVAAYAEVSPDGADHLKIVRARSRRLRPSSQPCRPPTSTG